MTFGATKTVVDDISSPTSCASTSYRDVAVLIFRFPGSELAGDVRPEMGGWWLRATLLAVNFSLINDALSSRQIRKREIQCKKALTVFQRTPPCKQTDRLP